MYSLTKTWDCVLKQYINYGSTATLNSVHNEERMCVGLLSYVDNENSSL